MDNLVLAASDNGSWLCQKSLTGWKAGTYPGKVARPRILMHSFQCISVKVPPLIPYTQCLKVIPLWLQLFSLLLIGSINIVANLQD